MNPSERHPRKEEQVTQDRWHSFGLLTYCVRRVDRGWQPVREGLRLDQTGRTYRWRLQAHFHALFGDPWQTEPQRWTCK